LVLLRWLTTSFGVSLKMQSGLKYFTIPSIWSFPFFVSYWFHELRSPLHGILNITQTVMDSEKKSLSDKNIKNMELIITVGRRMSFMLNDLIDLTLLKEGIIRLHVKSLQVQTVTSGVFDMLRYMTEGKPILLINTIPDTFPHVMVDENRLIQILSNLLHNAIKFTNEGNITIRAVEKSGKAYISIEDTGIGMDVETRRRIFESYEQGDSGMTAAPGGGIGLGLSICRQLVELHGETLEATSVPGKGSVFTFTLSLSDFSVQWESDYEPGLSPVYTETAVADSNVQSVRRLKQHHPSLKRDRRYWS
jgi:two-component system sensor histidine kinase ChiS